MRNASQDFCTWWPTTSRSASTAAATGCSTRRCLPKCNKLFDRATATCLPAGPTLSCPASTTGDWTRRPEQSTHSTQDWGEVRGYAFPSFCLIGWCLAKLGRQDVPSLVTITPLWQAQPWFPRLFQLAIARPRLLPTSPSLLLGRDQEPHPLVMTVRLPLLAWLLSAIPSQARDVQRKWSS